MVSRTGTPAESGALSAPQEATLSGRIAITGFSSIRIDSYWWYLPRSSCTAPANPSAPGSIISALPRPTRPGAPASPGSSHPRLPANHHEGQRAPVLRVAIRDEGDAWVLDNISY